MLMSINQSINHKKKLTGFEQAVHLSKAVVAGKTVLYRERKHRI